MLMGIGGCRGGAVVGAPFCFVFFLMLLGAGSWGD